jgi:glutathione synthase/RimK-type ligase-like ATP-grasp enzyme
VITSLAWVTARGARGLDEDEPVALAVLDRVGVRTEVVDWDDPEVDWARFDRVVLRSAWDYPERLPEFLAWLDRVGAASDLVNPPATVRWSLDKTYLAELAAAGLPVTPTAFVAPGETPAFPSGRFVVKPAVGAGSRDASSYDEWLHDLAAEHVGRLHDADQVVLVQPYLESVAREGEWPMVFVDGRFSHAASKRVSLPQAGSVDVMFAAETNAAHEATHEQVAVAQAVMDHVSARLGTPTSGRVDLVRGDDGRYCVLELELSEPSLFLRYADAAVVERFVAALVR